MRDGLSFPGVKLRSRDDFEEFYARERGELDARYNFEQSLGTKEGAVRRAGSCGACLKPATFISDTSGGATTADGRLVPNWRERQSCDCESRLISRYRATLHFLASEAGLRAWHKTLLLGPAGYLEAPLSSRCQFTQVPRLMRASDGHLYVPDVGLANPQADGGYHVVVTADYLPRVPAWREALTAIRRTLMAGGSFVFTAPFNVRESATVTGSTGDPQAPEVAHGIHQFGWELLDALRQAGFDDASAHLYWSAELGYLGPFNLIFHARA